MNSQEASGFAEACRFVMRVGTLAHGYGMSSYRIESYLARVTEALGWRGEFMVTPAFINFMFWRPEEAQQYSHFSRMSAHGSSISKVAQIGELVDQVEVGTLSLTEGNAFLDRLGEQPPPYGPLLTALGHALVGAGFAVLLSAAWRDVVLAVVLSLVVYAIIRLAGHSKFVARSLPLLAAAVVSALANVVAVVIPGSDPTLVTLCAVIVLIPGLGLTLAVIELSAQRILSGMQRLIDSVLTLVKLFLGAVIGTSIVNALWTVPPAAASPGFPPVVTWAFVALLLVGVSIAFKVRPQNIGWVVLGGILAQAASLVGDTFGFWQGSFVGATVLGIYANLFARWLRRPSSIVTMTAILVLVPGAAAYLGLQTAATVGAQGGLTAGWQVLVNIAAIIAGLLVAYALVPSDVTQ